MISVLFVTDTDGPDYLCDSVLHGLALSSGISLEVCGLSPIRHIKWKVERRGNPFWYMLDNCTPESLQDLYGRGFTLYGKLISCGKLISPFQLVRNLSAGMYDIVIVGRAWKTNWVLNVLDKMNYPNVVVLDGEDKQEIHQSRVRFHRYFKRELAINPDGNLRPISFAIPESLIVKSIPIKTGFIAPLVPGDVNTYIYTTEHSYYQSYRDHLVGITMKKAGWDCMRHYEISMNGCLPLMRDIGGCPPFTMTTTHKKLLVDIVKFVDANELGAMRDLTDELLLHVKNTNTTTKLSEYVLSESI